MAAHNEEGGRDRARAYRGLSGSFTVEAAVVVPLILAVLFLLLQTVIYLHDAVWAEVWMDQRAWQERYCAETAGAAGLSVSVSGDIDSEMQDYPKLAVLRFTDSQTSVQSKKVSCIAEFDVFLLPDFVSMIFTGQSGSLHRETTERVTDTLGMIRIAGAIAEERSD